MLPPRSYDAVAPLVPLGLAQAAALWTVGAPPAGIWLSLGLAAGAVGLSVTLIGMARSAARGGGGSAPDFPDEGEAPAGPPFAGYSKLVYWIHLGDLERFKEVLESGADPDEETLGTTALHEAIKMDRQEMSAILVRRGARVTPAALRHAVRERRLETVRLFMERPLDVMWESDDGRTALEEALDAGPEFADALAPASRRKELLGRLRLRKGRRAVRRSIVLGAEEFVRLSPCLLGLLVHRVFGLEPWGLVIASAAALSSLVALAAAGKHYSTAVPAWLGAGLAAAAAIASVFNVRAGTGAMLLASLLACGGAAAVNPLWDLERFPVRMGSFWVRTAILMSACWLSLRLVD